MKFRELLEKMFFCRSGYNVTIWVFSVEPLQPVNKVSEYQFILDRAYYGTHFYENFINDDLLDKTVFSLDIFENRIIISVY